MKGGLSYTPPISGTLSKKNNSMGGNFDALMKRGFSAYDVAVVNGFEGSQSEWLETLKGSEIELKYEEGSVYYKYQDDTDWLPLINIDQIIFNTVEEVQIQSSPLRLVDELPENPKENVMYIRKG